MMIEIEGKFQIEIIVLERYYLTILVLAIYSFSVIIKLIKLI